jgi:HPt (histidine-containing phosphotransfer) domain-containing protein
MAAPSAPVEATSSGAGAEDSAFDRAGLLDRLDGDEELAAEIVGLFIADCPAQLAGIQTAAHAGDAKALENLGHSLKGAARSVGANAIGSICALIESHARDGHLADIAPLMSRLEVEVHRASSSQWPAPSPAR